MHQRPAAERHHRLGRRHHLAAGCAGRDVVEVAGDLCGLHATDPATVYLGARARVEDLTTADLDRELYDRRRAIRMLGMRRTVWVLPSAMAGTVHHACTATVAAANRRRLARLLEDAGVATDSQRWLADAQREVLDVLAARGEALATELAAEVARLRTKVSLNPTKPYGATVALTNQVLTHLAAEGHIVRGRPKGAWTTNQYRWAPLPQWLPSGLGAGPPAHAERDLAAGWLQAFGPARAADLQWWAGWSAGQTRRALEAAAAVEVRVGGVPAWVGPDDLDLVGDPGPWAALLPALDPTPMGWTQRDWYLGGHRAELFDRSGNVGPTIWSDGRVVGGWAQRSDGEIAIAALEPVGQEAMALIEREADALRAWLGSARVKPRFPTPLEGRLRA